ncbi:MAG: glycosyltransferase [Aquabacterium sp.]|uniref:glycosyltransferase n=1 Tax=Aquabacterium sp. TaxID=1872578 RepID=UPI003BAE4A01
MPNLLSVNSYHYRRGGSDVVYLDHAALLGSQGWGSAFFSMHYPKNDETPWSKYFVKELEFGNSYSFKDKVVMAAKAVYSWEAQSQLKRLLNDHKIDVAHLHCIYHHLSPSILPVLSKAGIPTVMTAHDLKIACPAYKMLNHTGVCERCKDGSVINVVKHRCIRDSLGASVIVAVESGLQRHFEMYKRHLSKVVVPSRFFLEKFVEWGWPRDKFVYIPNYVDAGRFEPVFDPGSYFLYFGRLAPEKGVPTLIKAAVKAGVSLKIAGTGPLEAELKAIAAASAHPEKIEFVGFKSGDALHQLIQQSRAVVLPSEWYENAPMSVLESFAFGKPVIGASMGGIPELVNSETGWVFPSGDADALADLLASVEATPSESLHAKGRAARDHVASHFNRQSYLDATLKLYADLGVV